MGALDSKMGCSRKKKSSSGVKDDEERKKSKKKSCRTGSQGWVKRLSEKNAHNASHLICPESRQIQRWLCTLGIATRRTRGRQPQRP